jgi:hypothetical protein
MGAKPIFEVEGGARLRRTLRSAGAELEDFKNVHKDVGNIILPAAKANTPVVSGRLQNTVRAAGTNGGVIIRAGGAKVPYANVIHWWNQGRYTARPWVTTAARATEPAWLARYNKGIEEVLAKVEGV